jgi:hypothetical protein
VTSNQSERKYELERKSTACSKRSLQVERRNFIRFESPSIRKEDNKDSEEDDEDVVDDVVVGGGGVALLNEISSLEEDEDEEGFLRR